MKICTCDLCDRHETLEMQPTCEGLSSRPRAMMASPPRPKRVTVMKLMLMSLLDSTVLTAATRPGRSCCGKPYTEGQTHASNLVLQASTYDVIRKGMEASADGCL